jgi:hypothetical protein
MGADFTGVTDKKPHISKGGSMSGQNKRLRQLRESLRTADGRRADRHAGLADTYDPDVERGAAG